MCVTDRRPWPLIRRSVQSKLLAACFVSFAGRSVRICVRYVCRVSPRSEHFRWVNMSKTLFGSTIVGWGARPAIVWVYLVRHSHSAAPRSTSGREFCRMPCHSNRCGWLVVLCYKKGIPQYGHPLSRRSKICAIIMRNVAIDHGWCRPLRTGSTPRPEIRRDLGQG